MNFLYFFCSSVFVLLALPGRLLFTVVDLKHGAEYSETSYVWWHMVTSTGMWVDCASVVGFLAECIYAASDLEFLETTRLAILGSRMLCAWHMFCPLVNVNSQRVTLNEQVNHSNILMFLVA